MATVQDINNEIDRIETAKEGIAEAIEEKGVEIPEGAKIQAFPALIRQIPTAVTEIFWAEYGVTTPAEIEQALANGKQLFCVYGGFVHTYGGKDDNYHYFFAIVGNITYKRLQVSISGNGWGNHSLGITRKADQVTEIDANSDNNHYPSAKAVWDAIVAGKQIFWAIYGTTTAQQVKDAVNENKEVLCVDGALIYQLSDNGAEYIYFSCLKTGTAVNVLRLKVSNDSWVRGGQTTLENTANKVDTIVGNEDSTTKYPNTKAVNDFVVANKQVFWATYGTTTAAEIDAAVEAGKWVACLYNNTLYFYATKDSVYIYFGNISSETTRYLYISIETDVWNSSSFSLQKTTNRVNTITGNETATNKYPSTKAVADALGKMGVVSQTIQWFTAENSAQDYNILNPVTGLIPQSNIDLYEAAGAVFNDQTGYFELNGLTDIAYDEMKRIYAKSIGGAVFSVNKNSQFAQYDERTTVVLKFPAGYSTSINHMFTYSTIRVAYLVGANNLGSTQNTFNASPRVETIIGAIAATSFNNVVFSGCYSLKNVTISKLRSDVYFSHSSRLTLDSVVYMVQNATNTTAISITLHATAFARCQADTTEYTHEGQTYTGVIAYAAAKNITIQSA